MRVLVAGLVLSSSIHGLVAQRVAPQTGPWRAVLASPGGELPFGLRLERDGDRWRAVVENGAERIAFERVAYDAERSRIDIELTPYDSRITAEVGDSGARLAGTWRRRGAGDAHTEMVFSAVAGAGPRFLALAPAPDTAADGTFRVRFSSDPAPAVGRFTTATDGTLHGTFLTGTGDHRFLHGSFERRRLRLSCFDGAHAFLFDATLGPDGVLRGDFWSRDTWHETWTAHRDGHAVLDDPFAQTRWRAGAELGTLAFPDLAGVPRRLDDAAFAGRARVLFVFGTWCPNCKDASTWLAEVARREHARGLRVLGLAFELSGDRARDLEQCRRYAAHQRIDFPILVAGIADKDAASRALPLLDRVRAYPTTVFLHGDGRVHSVHTGFSGPATGNDHAALLARFDRILAELLD